MADSLKQFGNDTAITYSELKSGQSIVSTSGSQKAVIKDISIDNPNGRNLNVSIDSASGTKVSSTKSKVDTLSGNLILDNSQSLHLSTPDTCAITDIRMRGWGAGSDHNSSSFWSFGDQGTQFSPWTWNGDVGDPNVNASAGDRKQQYHLGTNITTNASNGFVANGYFYWHQKRQGGAYNTQTMLRTDYVKGSSGAGSTVTTYGVGKAYVMAYDGSRYIYTMEQENSVIRKYDTNTLGTSDTYTTITVLQPDSDSNAQTIRFDAYCSTFYFRDGFLFISNNAENDDTNDEGKSRIIDVATGKSRLVYDPGTVSTYYSSISRGYHRRAMGIARDSSGTYWTMIGSIKNPSGNEENNRIYGCSLGASMKDFVANGGSYGSTYNYRLYDWNSNSGEREKIRQPFSTSGYKFGNSCGAVMYTPGIDRYLYTYNRSYSSSNTNGGNGFSAGGQYCQIIMDFDKVMDGIASTTGFITMPSRTTMAENWDLQAWVDPDIASSTFGTVKARTAGILIT
tara:strand:+ start:1380 stop:2909 length:1530 start_codon:yes stop_codon:yes gene_type:complete